MLMSKSEQHNNQKVFYKERQHHFFVQNGIRQKVNNALSHFYTFELSVSVTFRKVRDKVSVSKMQEIAEKTFRIITSNCIPSQTQTHCKLPYK